jgi:16S rRNA (guanine966-N2)-methyltransferase
MAIRIISGAARGRRLQVPDNGTRPTSERARAALFDRLTTMLDVAGSRVLDLYAGSGAVGLEALSRHAAEAWFVENDPGAVAVLRANVANVTSPGSGVSGLARLWPRSVTEVLAGSGPSDPFDIVFADPPYATAEDDLAATLARVAEPRWTSPGALVVVERATRGPEPRWPERLASLASKRYGEGTLWYGQSA